MSKVTHTRKNPGAVAAIGKAYQLIGGFEVAMGWFGPGATEAAINYFGAPAANIPARDALTPAIRATLSTVHKVSLQAALKANRGEVSAGDLQPIADAGARNLKDAIRTFSSPANARSTVAKKGFNDPLIGVSGGRILDSAGAKIRRAEK